MSLLPSAFPPAPPAPLPTPEPTALLGWQARRGVSAQWRLFNAALLDCLEEAGRDETLLLLEGRVNDALAAMDWGHAEFFLDQGRRALVIRHLAAPLVPTKAAPDGGWTHPALVLTAQELAGKTDGGADAFIGGRWVGSTEV